MTTIATGGAGGSPHGPGSASAGGDASASSDATLNGPGSVSSTAIATGGAQGVQVMVEGPSGAASARSAASDADGSVATTAQSPAVASSPSNGAAIAETLAVVGAGSSALAPIVAGETISDATLTSNGPTIGGGVMSAGATECCGARNYSDEADFTFATGARERLSLTLLDTIAAGSGFASARFTVTVDGRAAVADRFTSLRAAERFFSGRTLDLGVVRRGGRTVAVSFALTPDADVVMPAGGFGFDYSLQDPAVPEPATWAMLLIGFAGLGRAMRSRNRRAA
ncbi:putative secreted protein with PEP-CTERM sorting signal [Roseiarcus fermentans]|uniref:Putative secreted protein with PEP-CTERM sorting signal n=1 Tax=Roseiarcus fermentans TaxID=1473586 RepID=A0A366FSJ2_9HYPH|nr:PEPxxWA-CTERM sorting domain-containing protein [Roseiarcus fermentans]RBP17116.1 putative secreted protein with PEP-CTERM sorting signal [Roseiarcus fermentans]